MMNISRIDNYNFDYIRTKIIIIVNDIKSIRLDNFGSNVINFNYIFLISLTIIILITLEPN